MSVETKCCTSSATTLLERPRFFARQLVTPGDLTLGQDYFRARLRLHNRLLHGWGVVCGLQVCFLPRESGTGVEPWKVRVKSGYAIAPCGDDILVACERIVDLRTPEADTDCHHGHHGGDPWCTDVRVDTRPGVVYLAVKYSERPARPVRVQPHGCGCDEALCEHSRWRDCYEFGVLLTCPPHHDPPEREDLEQMLTTLMAGCPECPDDPWVGLARIELDTDGTVLSIDNCACRRIVPSAALLWRTCRSARIRIEAPQRLEVKPGDREVVLRLRGEHVHNDAKVEAGRGITVRDISQPAAGEVALKLDIANDALPGPKTITITNPDGSAVAIRDAITVTAAAPGPSPPAPEPPTRGPRRRHR